VLERLGITVKGKSIDLDCQFRRTEHHVDLIPGDSLVGPPARDAMRSQQSNEEPLGVGACPVLDGPQELACPR
jgi:hypothetical protein